MTLENPTLFQQIIHPEAASGMISDFNNPEQLVPEDKSIEDIDGWEIAVKIKEDDIPRMLEELREIENAQNEPQ